VFAAINIANALRAQQTSKGRTVETLVEGLAASSASIVMMAGSRIQIADNGMVMVHNPWTVAVGQAGDMRKTAEALDEIRKTIVATYKWHSKLSDAELIALMDAETWLDADAAIANGFATEKVEGLKVAASFSPRVFARLKTPEKFKARVAALVKPAPAAASAADVLGVCAGANLDLAFATGLINAGLSMPDVQARVDAERETRRLEQTRVQEIRGLCRVAQLPMLADAYIAGQMPVAAVRDQLSTIAALIDGEIVIDTNLGPDNMSGMRTTPRSTINTAAIYADRNRPFNSGAAGGTQ
jgi:hypothetical protein